MEKSMSHNCEYVRKHYQVPAKICRRVIVYGKPGVIPADRGHYIGVLLDEDPRRGSATTTQPMKCSTARWQRRCGSKSGWSYRSSITGMTSTGTGKREDLVRVWAATRGQAKYKAYERLQDYCHSIKAMLHFKVRRA